MPIIFPFKISDIAFFCLFFSQIIFPNMYVDMKTTLQHIAEDTGLSVSTISRVLRGTGKISSKTQKLILESAQKLNYPFKKSNTPLSLRQDIHIALLANVHGGEYYSAFFRGFNEAAVNTNIHFSMFSVRDREDETLDLIQQLRNKHFDGIVLFLNNLSYQDYKNIKDLETEDFVIVSTAVVQRPLLDSIAFDNYSGGFIAAEHFLDKGYLQVGLIKGPATKSDARFRANGFIDGLAAHPSMELNWVYDGDFNFEAGRNALLNFLESDKKPRAVFSVNDVMAFGFLEMANRQGVKIPTDVALVGLDDLPSCISYHPTISSIHTDYKRLGEVVVERIQNRLSTKNREQGVLTNLIPVTLIQRESS